MKLQTRRLTLTASKPLKLILFKISDVKRQRFIVWRGILSNFREKHGDHFENLTTWSIVSPQLLHEFLFKMQSKFKQTSKNLPASLFRRMTNLKHLDETKSRKVSQCVKLFSLNSWRWYMVNSMSQIFTHQRGQRIKKNNFVSIIHFFSPTKPSSFL